MSVRRAPAGRREIMRIGRHRRVHGVDRLSVLRRGLETTWGRPAMMRHAPTTTLDQRQMAVREAAATCRGRLSQPGVHAPHQPACRKQLHASQRDPVARIAAIPGFRDPTLLIDQEISRHQVGGFEAGQPDDAQAPDQRQKRVSLALSLPQHENRRTP